MKVGRDVVEADNNAHRTASSREALSKGGHARTKPDHTVS
jgi:hypothetical protein